MAHETDSGQRRVFGPKAQQQISRTDLRRLIDGLGRRSRQRRVVEQGNTGEEVAPLTAIQRQQTLTQGVGPEAAKAFLLLDTMSRREKPAPGFGSQVKSQLRAIAERLRGRRQKKSGGAGVFTQTRPDDRDIITGAAQRSRLV